ncbi:MAG: rhodanese-like domain-containing protein [Acidobacteriota bacterium]|nr:rhodanese-like domain-containing protein [Acidobacteriota bacterium]
MKSEIRRVNPAELRALLQKGDAVAVDVRGSVPYELGHIAGAKWVPLGLMNQRAGELDQQKLIVTYCTCKAEETSLEGALLLANEHGFERVAVLQGGYPAWKEAGFAIEATQTSEVAVEAPVVSMTSGRLAPPAAVECDRNQLTSHAGRVTRYRRERDKTTLVMKTSAGTTETLVVSHKGVDPMRFYLINGTPFTSRDWTRIEGKKHALRGEMSAVAWVCRGGRTIIDWRPGVTFTGAE